MSEIRQSFRTKSTVEKLNNSSLEKQNRRSVFEKGDDQEVSKKSNDQKKKEFAHVDFIERLIIGKITFLFFFFVYPEHEVVSHRFVLCIKREGEGQAFLID